MTKEEAIKAMSEGKKVTHPRFMPSECMTMLMGMIVFDDGVVGTAYTPQEFWQWRTATVWNDGYEIF